MARIRQRDRALEQFLAERNLKITTWTAADLDVDEAQLGLGGSPTQVHKINYVVLEGAESKEVTPTPEGIRGVDRRTGQRIHRGLGANRHD